MAKKQRRVDRQPGEQENGWDSVASSSSRKPGVSTEELAAAKHKADRTFVLTWLAVIVITPLLVGALMWLLYRHDLNTFLSGIVVVTPLAVVFAAWQMVKRFVLGRKDS